MNPLREILGVDDIELDADLDSADAVLARLAAMLSRQQGLPASEILRGLEARERLGSTAHARVPACQREAAVLLRTRSPIVFGAPDARPVTLFLGLVVPAQASEEHLRLLAAAAELLDDRARRVALKAATSPAAVRAILDALPELPP
jgi:PTS system nitrogen regulatory IIA component